MDLFSLEAEKAVLGAILSSEVISEVEGEVGAEDFSEQRNKDIYEVCLELSTEGHPIDPVIVKSRLQERGKLLTSGGFNYLITLANNTPETGRAMHYAKIVSRLAVLRAAEGAIRQQAQLVHSTDNESLDDLFAKMHAALEAVEPEAQDEALLMWAASFEKYQEMQEERREEEALIASGEIVARPSLPWQNLKYFGINYIRPETFAVLAADSSVGKTSFLETVAEHNAEQGLNVVFFHLELSHKTMLDRRKVRHSGEPMELVESGTETEAMKEADWKMRQWPGGVHYVHCPGWSARRIVNYSRMLKRKGKCDLVIVDYLQKVQLYYRRGWTEENALADVGEVVKNSAEKLGIPYIVGSQMNRASKAEKRRTSIGIRGSGQIEEKCNLSITLNREILDEAFVHQETGELIAQEGVRSPVTDVRVDKNSFGPTGDTQLWMQADRFTFYDVKKESLDDIGYGQ